MEAGEYFTSQSKKRQRAEQDRAEAQVQKVEARKAQRQAAFQPPEVGTSGPSLPNSITPSVQHGAARVGMYSRSAEAHPHLPDMPVGNIMYSSRTPVEHPSLISVSLAGIQGHRGRCPSVLVLATLRRCWLRCLA